MCNNIPAGRRLLGGVGAGDTGDDGGGAREEGGPSIHPSAQISINQDGSLHSSSYQIRQMITGIQATRAVDGEGPSRAAIRPPLASRRSRRRITVFFFS